jgi:hypothetical protein
MRPSRCELAWRTTTENSPLDFHWLLPGLLGHFALGDWAGAQTLRVNCFPPCLAGCRRISTIQLHACRRKKRALLGRVFFFPSPRGAIRTLLLRLGMRSALSAGCSVTHATSAQNPPPRRSQPFWHCSEGFAVRICPCVGRGATALVQTCGLPRTHACNGRGRDTPITMQLQSQVAQTAAENLGTSATMP